jgi:ketosteroid isomerase-like protein
LEELVNGSSLEERIRDALESGDLDKIADLLHPNVSWGPPDHPEWGCHNRKEVLAWYRRGKNVGARARVTEVVGSGSGVDGTLLVGLVVTGNERARDAGGEIERWQVLKVREGRVVDIRGFGEREIAAGHAGIS